MRKKDVHGANQETLNYMVELNYLNNDLNASNASELLFGKGLMSEFAVNNHGSGFGLLRASVLGNYVRCQATVIQNSRRSLTIGLRKNLKNN
jgi:hypothetical protein